MSDRSHIELLEAPAIVTPASAHWPASLSRLPAPPRQLRVAGTLPSWERAVAIVGTRRASDEAVAFTERLAFDLASLGCVIVSGGAHGIDAAAHRGCLRARGVTVAVLATGLVKAYPSAHGGLFSAIARDGALLTECPSDEAAAQGYRFLSRNRLIAALCSAVIVVEAPLQSGALSTAHWAKKMEIPILAVPGSPWDPRFAGTLSLLRRSAAICTSARDALTIAAIPVESQTSTGGGEAGFPRLTEMDASESRVFRSVGSKGVHADVIAKQAKLPIRQVQQILARFSLRGWIEATSAGTYIRPAALHERNEKRDKSKS